MFSTVSLGPPRNTHILWQRSPSPPPTTNEPPSTQQRRNVQRAAKPTALQLLCQQEELVMQRKVNVRKFGSTWLRPPGIAKTYQAMLDEAAERAEQEALAERERGMAEALEAQRALERQNNPTAATPARMDLDVGQPSGDTQEEEVDDEEVNLDDEVPDADERGSSSDAAFEESYVEGERDLDDEVPEAGSYQHTDTEAEDDTSEDDDGDRSDMFPHIQRNAAPNAHLASQIAAHIQSSASRQQSSPHHLPHPDGLPSGVRHSDMQNRLHGGMQNEVQRNGRVMQDFGQPPVMRMDLGYSQDAISPTSPSFLEGDSSMVSLNSPTAARGGGGGGGVRSGSPMPRRLNRPPPPPPNWGQP